MANKGERRRKIWHFSHKSRAQCFGALEGSLHIAVKALVEQHKCLMLPPCTVIRCPPSMARILDRNKREIGEFVSFPYKYTPAPDSHLHWKSSGAGVATHPKAPFSLSFDSVHTEQTEGNIRPDIVGVVGGRPIFLEVAVTHFIDVEKLARLRTRDTPTLELVVPDADKTQWNWNTLRSWLFERVDGKFWALNPRVERLADAAFDREQVAFAKRREAEERQRIAREAYQAQKAVDDAEREASRLKKETALIQAAELWQANEQALRQSEREAAEAQRAAYAKEVLARSRLASAEAARQRAVIEALQQDARSHLGDDMPSPYLDPTALPVLFLDYDTAIQPAYTGAARRLGYLASALRDTPCSVVITSEVRSRKSVAELAVELAPLGGRHLSYTPVVDPNDPYGNRGQEILSWLDAHRVPSYCIIDGARSGFSLRTLWVSPQEGLTPEGAKELAFYTV